MPETLSVVVLGPSARVRGGISRVVSRVCEELPDSVRVAHVATFTQYTGYGEGYRGSRAVQFMVYVAALVRTVWYSLFLPRAVFDIHLSQRGSYLRKGILAAWLRCVGARFIVHTHACDREAFLRRVPDWINRLMLWGLHGAQVCLVLTEHWKRYYAAELKFPKDRLVVLPNPANIPAVVPNRPATNTLELLFLGRLGERKGTFDLIRAFAALPPSVRSRCRMTMAGDGEVEQAAALAQSLGCAEEIRVRSWLRPDEVRQLLTESDIFVLPSRGEGMSTALLEAMGWGLAIITTSEGGADEFLKDGSSALLVPAGGVPDITRAIERLVNDEGLRLSLGRHARRAAIPFDIRHHVDRLMGIYRGVARQPHEKRVARDHGVETPRPAGTMD